VYFSVIVIVCLAKKHCFTYDPNLIMAALFMDLNVLILMMHKIITLLLKDY